MGMDLDIIEINGNSVVACEHCGAESVEYYLLDTKSGQRFCGERCASLRWLEERKADQLNISGIERE